MSLESLRESNSQIPVEIDIRVIAFIEERVSDTCQPFKRQPHKMVKHTQIIPLQKSTNRLSVFDHFVGLALKGLKKGVSNVESSWTLHVHL